MTGPELRATLERLGLSQAALARELGKHPDSVMRWCNDKVPVPKMVALYLAQMERP